MTNELIYRFGEIEVNDTRHVVTVGGNPVALTPNQYRILLFLISNPGHCISEETLLHDVLGYNEDAESRTVCTHIKRLRKSLGEFGRMIVNMRSFGYKLDAV
jgi:two-component system alkaline phosphatase synthesis response regulator PhoP